jgi:hypothetical protein
MKRMPAGGYTILEVMIFLVVSTALLGSTLLILGGREDRTRYAQSVATFEAELQDIMNDVATGFYPSTENISCTSASTGPSISNSASKLGTNGGCIYLGKALSMPTGTSQYSAYTIVGSQSASTLAQMNARLLGVLNNGFIDRKEVGGSIKIKRVKSLYADRANLAGVAIISDFSASSAVLNSNITGSSARVAVYEIPQSFNFATANNGSVASMVAGMRIASEGVLICLDQGGPQAAVVLGGPRERQLNTEAYPNLASSPYAGDCF